MDGFRTTHPLVDNTYLQRRRTLYTEFISAVEENPNESIRHYEQSLWKVVD